LQSGLIPFPKEQIDISLICFSKGLHRDVVVRTSLFILFRRPDLNSDNQVRGLDPVDVDRSSSP
jgi:hypothetical protein